MYSEMNTNRKKIVYMRKNSLTTFFIFNAIAMLLMEEKCNVEKHENLCKKNL